MVAAGRGDREAFADLIERHQGAVIQFIFRFLGTVGRDTAEDLAQDVFLKAWTSARSYRPKAKVLTWLLHLARNTALNYRRGQRLRRTVPLEHAGERAAAGPADAGAASAERAAEVQAAIAALPDKQRATIILRHYLGLAYTDIAETQGVSIAAVESLLFRARDSLRTSLGPPQRKDESAPQVSAPSGAEHLREDKVPCCDVERSED